MDISWSLNIVQDSSGSASIKYGSSMVLASIHGPKALSNDTTRDPTDLGQFSCSVRYASHILSLKLQNGLDTSRVDAVDTSMMNLRQESLHTYETILRSTFEKIIRLDQYPKCNIGVHIMILQSSNKDIPAMITCVSLALMNAGIQMYDMVTSAHLSFKTSDNSDNSMQNDKNKNLEDSMGMTIAYASHLQEITYIQMTGKIDTLQIGPIVAKLREKCDELMNLIKSKVCS